MTFHDPVIGADGSAAPLPVPQPSRRRWFVVLAVVGAMAVIGAVAAWRMVSGFGSATDSSTAVPADADFYVNIDLATFLDTELLGRIARTFPEASEELGNPDDVIAGIDRELQDELGVTFTDDIRPWIGRSLGVAGWDIEAWSGEPQNFVISIKVRDGAAADGFLEKLAARGGGTIGRYHDAVLWELTLDDEPAYAARVDDLLLVAPNSEALDIAIDTKLGFSDSLHQNPNYVGALAELPDGPGNMLWYLGDGLWREAFNPAGALMFGGGSTVEQLEQIRSVVMAFNVNDNGVRVDVASLLDPELAAFYANERVDEAIAAVPADALFYFAADYGPVLDMYRDMLTDPEVTGSVDFESELGFDPVTEGLDLLDGRVTIYGRPGATVEGGFGIDLGLAAMLGVSDPVTMSTTLDKVEAFAGVGPEVDRSDALRRIQFEGTPFVYGVDAGNLTIAYNTDPVHDRTGPRITENAAYEGLAGLLGDDLSLFVDVPTLVDRYANEPETGLRAFGAIGATWTASGDTVTGSVMVQVDWAN